MSIPLRIPWLLLLLGFISNLCAQTNSGDSSRILMLSRERKLGIFTPATTHYQAFNQSDVVLFDISPDNTRFLFVTMQQEPRIVYQLYVSDLEMKSPQLIKEVGDPAVWFIANIEKKSEPMFQESGGPLYPHWAPDGKRILYSTSRETNGTFSYNIYDVDKKSDQVLLRVPGPLKITGTNQNTLEEYRKYPFTLKYFQMHNWMDNWGYDPAIDFSKPGPDGKKTLMMVWHTSNIRWHPSENSVTWTSDVDQTNRFTWVRSLEGFDPANPISLTNNATRLTFGEDFLWSPNGKQLALIFRFMDASRRTGLQVLLTDRTGKEIRELHREMAGTGGAKLRLLSWSPDSSKLAFFVNSSALPNTVRLTDVTAPNRTWDVPGVAIGAAALPAHHRRFTTFGLDNKTFYMVGFTNDGRRTYRTSIDAVTLPSTNATPASPTATTNSPIPVLARSVVYRHGDSIEAIGLIGPPQSDDCEPLDLPAPSAARQWITEATGDNQVPNGEMDPKDRAALIARLVKRRGQLFEALATLETARDHQKDLNEKLKTLLKQEAQLNPLTDRKAYRDKLIERIALQRNIRAEESDYIRGATLLGDTFSEEESKRLLQSLQAHSRCLSKNTSKLLDAAREVNYVSSWEIWRLKNYTYEASREELQHTLKLWQSFNAARQAKMERLIQEARQAEFIAKGSVTPGALRSYQRALRDVYLDMGECGLLFSQSMVEQGSFAQESYLASYKGVQQQNTTLEEANELRYQAEQAFVFGLKYAVALGGDGFKAITDSAKRVLNYAKDKTGLELSTMAGDVTKGLQEGREKFDWALRVIDRIRGYSDEQTMALRQRQGEGTMDPGMKFLSEDYNFFIQSGGGLLRLAACYSSTFPEQIEVEYAIAMEKARRMTVDMRKAFNALRGAEASSDFTTWRKLLLTPFSVMKTLLQGTPLGGDQFTATEHYIQNRESEVTEMEGLIKAFEQVKWDAQILGDKYPKFYQTYLWLRWNNPFFLEWDLLRERYLTQQRIEVLDREAHLAWIERDEEKLRTIQSFRQKNEHYLGISHPRELARLFQLQGCDRLMIWDYDGALECFYQANEFSEVDARQQRVARQVEAARTKKAPLPVVEIQPRANVEQLRTELNIRKIKDARLDVIFTMGDSIFISRMFQGLGQWTYGGMQKMGIVSKRTPKPGPPPPVKGFWSRPIPHASWIGDTLWGAVNPFSDLFGAAAVEREWEAIGTAALSMSSQVGQDIATELSRVGLINLLGVKQEYADFLANIIVNTATAQPFKPDSLDTMLISGAKFVKASGQNIRARIFDTEAHNEQKSARHSFAEFWKYLEQMREFRRATEGVHQRSLADAQAKEVHAAGEKLHAQLEPLKVPEAKRALEKLAATQDPNARLQLIAEFFQKYPITAEGGPVRDLIKQLKKEKNPEADTLNEQIDAMRWELISSAMERFLGDNERFRSMLLDYVFIGAAANKNGKAYRDKKCLTDVDFTGLLRADVTNEDRAAFENTFNSWFEGKWNLSLGHLDVSVMGDFRPTFHRKLESTESLLSIRDKSELEALLKVLEADAEKVSVDAFHGERYYEQGNIAFLNLGLKIVGNLKQPKREGNDLKNEPQEKVDQFFEGIHVEPWMAFDVAIGQLGFLMRHKEARINEATGQPYMNENGTLALKDPVAYHKYLCKYPGTRGLFGYLLMSKPAREMLVSLTKEHADANGWESMEEVVCHVAKLIINKHGLKELGLPQTHGTEAESRDHYFAMFDMWLLSKSGASPELVAARAKARYSIHNERPARVGDLTPLQSKEEVNAVLAEHTKQTEAMFRRLIGRSIMAQAMDLKKLENAAHEARKSGSPDDLLRAQVLEAQMKRIVTRMASTWFRMKRELHPQVLRETMEIVTKEAPGMGDDWIYAILAAENMGQRIAKTPPGTTPSIWKPHVFIKDDDALNTAAAKLREQARGAGGPRLLESQMEAAR